MTALSGEFSGACATCRDTGWMCAAYPDRPADFSRGTCCRPQDGEFGLLTGSACPSANGCPDCGRALSTFPTNGPTGI